MRFIVLILFSILINAPLCASVIHSFYNSTLNNTRMIANVEAIKPGESFWILFEIDPKKGWHTFWKNPGDSGMPLSFAWDTDDGVSVSEIKWFPPKRIPVAHLVNYGYDDKAYYLVKISAPAYFKGKSIHLKATASWLVCEKECIPDESIYNLNILVKDKTIPSKFAKEIQDQFDKWNSYDSLNLTTYQLKDFHYFNLPPSLVDKGEISDIYLFMEEKGVISPNEPQKIIAEGKNKLLKASADFKKVGAVEDGYMKVTQKGKDTYYRVKIESKVTLTLSVLLSIIAFAFIGGLILNIMPCVLPVLSVKVLSLVKYSHLSRKELILKGLTYTAGVISSFLLLASIIILIKHSGYEIGWGFQLQYPAFVMGLIFLFFIIGLNLFGYFEFSNLAINLPFADNKNYWEDFFTGALAVLVASPCTAPFMATSIGLALSHSISVIYSIFFALGLGFAFPFLLISFATRLQRYLPKPGPWMVRIKEFLGFPMMATCIWLLWIVDQQVARGEFCFIIMGLLGISLAIWLYKNTAFPLLKWILILLASVSIIGVISKIVSHEEPAPPPLYTISDIEKLSAQQDVFVNITASWCITCKVNETLVLNQADIQQAFKKKNIAYLSLDWTNRNEEISNYMRRFNRRGIPLNIYIPKNGKPIILPQVLTKTEIMKYLN